jgi:hypothetical protein
MLGYFVDEDNNGWGFQIGDYNGDDSYGMLYYFTRMGVPVWTILNLEARTSEGAIYSVHTVRGDGLPGSTRIIGVDRCGTLELRNVEDKFDTTLSLMNNSPLADESTPSPHTPWPQVHRFTAKRMVDVNVPAPDPDAVG